jgi:hypothetical protein
MRTGIDRERTMVASDGLEIGNFDRPWPFQAGFLYVLNETPDVTGVGLTLKLPSNSAAKNVNFARF